MGQCLAIAASPTTAGSAKASQGRPVDSVLVFNPTRSHLMDRFCSAYLAGPLETRARVGVRSISWWRLGHDVPPFNPPFFRPRGSPSRRLHTIVKQVLALAMGEWASAPLLSSPPPRRLVRGEVLGLVWPTRKHLSTFWLSNVFPVTLLPADKFVYMPIRTQCGDTGYKF